MTDVTWQQVALIGLGLLAVWMTFLGFFAVVAWRRVRRRMREADRFIAETSASIRRGARTTSHRFKL